ncbi:hypothetical protein J437_LFUL017937 [Ladona fulva]|uniref:Uncharacterized protein n=1 Tax=Ladona fulva TaxID=123851 RepID=A0A8K0KUT2_LADFU|nr:hypothetical protein J437_LFUL017937 [Ladona fulva]
MESSTPPKDDDAASVSLFQSDSSDASSCSTTTSTRDTINSALQTAKQTAMLNSICSQEGEYSQKNQGSDSGRNLHHAGTFHAHGRSQ